MKKSTRKLALTTETVRQLDTVALGRVAGAGSILIRCGVTLTCPGCCPQPSIDSPCPTK